MIFRGARAADLPALTALLADDDLSQAREGGAAADYAAAFARIGANPALSVVVGEEAGEVVAMFELALLPGLSRRGAVRAVVESLRVARGRRGRGLGRAAMAEAEARARAGGAAWVELLTDCRRDGARAFYAALGYVESHRGFKKPL